MNEFLESNCQDIENWGFALFFLASYACVLYITYINMCLHLKCVELRFCVFGVREINSFTWIYC